MSAKISVLMPAYNEGRAIRSNVLAVDRMLKTFKAPYEIIVVDDGSGDWTFEEAKKAAKGQRHIHVKRNELNQGKGWALKEAFRIAKGDWIVFLETWTSTRPSSSFFSRYKSAGRRTLSSDPSGIPTPS
jgi:glycosyltransferase involved in cell wall biosynthesis